jgi:hypothetical protein
MRIFAMCAVALTSLGTAVSGAPQPSAQAAQSTPATGPGTWSEKAHPGEQRTEAAVVELNGKIYMLGGMARGQDAHALNQEYDPATDRWRERAPMPHALSHAGAAALNGKIYVVGGFLRNVHLDAQDLVRIRPGSRYLADAGAHEEPRARWGGRARRKDSRDRRPRRQSGHRSTHEVYDPATGRWASSPAAQGPRSSGRDCR